MYTFTGVCIQQHGKNSNSGLHPLLFSSGPEECLTLCSFWTLHHKGAVLTDPTNLRTHSPFPNVSPIRASILGHLRRDSFDCHVTPFTGRVWKPPPQPRPRIPDLLLWQCPLPGCGLRMETGQCCSNVPNPASPTRDHLPQRFTAKRGWGGASVPRAFFFHPQAFPLNQCLLIYTL